MKKLIFSSLVLCIAFSLQAQDVKKTKSAYLLAMSDKSGKQIEDARKEIDKAAADPKAQGKADVWFCHATVYGSLFEDSALSLKYPSAGDVAMTSFHKYAQLDPGF